ncbi:MAG: F0F1 ATP synthase subunit A [Chloroflexi bacterium]|nr:F0F1 ATP synthase subunit A [Chloroflexota bacterium]
MGKLLYSPKLLAIAIAAIAALLVSVAGGALGASFGLGFLGGPIPFISIPAERVAYIGSYPLLNSTVMFWVGGFVLIFIAWRAGRNVKDIPSGWQNLMEMIYEFFSNTVDGVAGGTPKAGRRFLALVSTIFLVVMIINWVGILPGVGSIGRIESIEEWVHHHAAELEADVGASNPEYNQEQIEAAALVHLLEEHGSDTFVAFDGIFVPLGQGEQARVPLNKIVSFTDADLHEIELAIEHGDDLAHVGTLESIHHDIEAGVVKSKFTYDVGGDKETDYNFTGRTAGLLVPYFRGASTDINTTLAIAIIAMFTVQLWGFRALGVRGYGGKFLVNPITKGPIATFVGVLEAFGELTRTISFTFRLFGNMFAGEILLIAMAFLLPLIGIIPFMGLELFVGVIQAYIFAMLTLVFGVMAVASHGDHDSHAEDH